MKLLWNPFNFPLPRSQISAAGIKREEKKRGKEARHSPFCSSKSPFHPLPFFCEVGLEKKELLKRHLPKREREKSELEELWWWW